uniref:Uncharacterized protein n=1 Tax=Picea sitchensis TaxID=3332 RepID=A9NM34_PICSI|nr:unknown [Picea sitchensis]
MEIRLCAVLMALLLLLCWCDGVAGERFELEVRKAALAQLAKGSVPPSGPSPIGTRGGQGKTGTGGPAHRP